MCEKISNFEGQHRRKGKKIERSFCHFRPPCRVCGTNGRIFQIFANCTFSPSLWINMHACLHQNVRHLSLGPPFAERCTVTSSTFTIEKFPRSDESPRFFPLVAGTVPTVRISHHLSRQKCEVSGELHLDRYYYHGGWIQDPQGGRQR